MISDSTEVDLVDELHLRCLAREYYVSTEHRDAKWHPVILDEMSRKDKELMESPTMA